MASEVDILIKATDKASRDIEKVNRALGETTKTGGGLKRAFGDLKTAVPGLGQAFTFLTNPITLATAGIGALIKVSAESIGTTVAYNKEIRELTQTLGLSAEETSRVVQVADDWGISIEQVHSALALMNKNGVTPSIENLADLADEYVNTTDKAAFAERASKLLGRQYETLIPLFVEGGDALRAQAAAVDDSLIATDKSIAASRKYELAMDGLRDAVDGVKYSIGNKLIPEVADLTEAFLDSMNAAQEFSDVLDEYNKKVEDGTIIEDRRVQVTTSMGRANRSAAAVQETMTDAIERATEAAQLWEEQIQDVIPGDIEMAARHREGADAARDHAAGIGEFADALEAALTPEEELAAAQEILNQKMSDLNMVIGGNLGPTIEEFNEQQLDLKSRMGEVVAQIDILEGKSYLTQDQRDELTTLQGEYDTLKQQYSDNAAEHEDATKRILFDLLTQRAALDGLSEAEFVVLNQIAVDWGIVDQATADAALGFDAALRMLNPDGTGVVQALAGVRAVAQSVAGIEGTYDIRFNVSVTGDSIPSMPSAGGTPIAYASGAHFVIPPGYEDDSYPIGYGKSGEEVYVIPKEQRNTTTNNFSMNIHTNAGVSTLSSDFAMMRARAG